MDLETFQSLSTEEVAQLVRRAGPKVCVFPINGTRRWFRVEHSIEPGEDFVSIYLDRVGKRQIELYKMIFDHGIDTLLAPILGPDILERPGYEEFLERGLAYCAESRDFLDFYGAYDVRVRVYGDAKRCLRNSPYAGVLVAFENLVRLTAAHKRHRLFFGICAHDPAETVAAIGVRFQQEHNRLPEKQEIVEAYYGEYVGPVSFFIGFSKLRTYFMPLLTTGTEDLYFMLSPSPYLTERQLRDILYDHLYTRREEPDWSSMTPEDLARLNDVYRANRGSTLGIGTSLKGVWFPVSGAVPPSGPAE